MASLPSETQASTATRDVVTSSTIAHGSGVHEVVIQIGDYDLGNSPPDYFVNAPEVVVYGDGDAYADLVLVRNGVAEHELVRAHLDEEALQQVLAAGALVPETLPPDTNVPADVTPLFVRVGNDTWERYDNVTLLRALLDDIRAVVRAGQTGEWRPSAWVARRVGDEGCTVTTDDPHLLGYNTPVYPHDLTAFPIGSMPCTAPPPA